MRRLAAGLTVAVALTGCGGGSSVAKARPVTAAEANRLAIMRFLGYQETGQHFHTAIVTGKGSVTLDGYVDYRQQIGYAEASQPGGAFTLEWSATTELAWPSSTPLTTPPPTLPAAAPISTQLNPTSSDINAALALLLDLGQDRPDNAQLIVQDGATWLRSASIGTTKVDVMQGPGPQGGSKGSGAALTYWVDARGNLLRVDAAFGGSTPTEIDLDAGFKPVTRAAQLR